MWSGNKFMSEKLEYDNQEQKFLAFLLGTTVWLWVPIYEIYTSIADFGVNQYNKHVGEW